MDDEDEIEGLFISHAIEDEHGLDSKVPGTGTVGRGYDNGYRAYDERDQCTTQTQVCREIEAEEGEVVVQEVADPNTKASENAYVHDVCTAAFLRHPLTIQHWQQPQCICKDTNNY